MNLILDMDETLLNGTPIAKGYNLVFGRPGLKLFLQYVFDKFEKVSIWTHATKPWYNICHKKVIQDALPEGKEFFTVITQDNGLIPLRKDLAKDLTKFYELYPCHNEKNTLIIDDSPHTYKLNTKNAIPIEPFIFNYYYPDAELYRLMHWFECNLPQESQTPDYFNMNNESGEEEEEELNLQVQDTEVPLTGDIQVNATVEEVDNLSFIRNGYL